MTDSYDASTRDSMHYAHILWGFFFLRSSFVFWVFDMYISKAGHAYVRTHVVRLLHAWADRLGPFMLFQITDIVDGRREPYYYIYCLVWTGYNWSYDRDLRLTGKEFFPQKNSLASTQLDEGMYACMNVSPYVLLTLLIKMTPYIIVELINIFRVFIWFRARWVLMRLSTYYMGIPLFTNSTWLRPMDLCMFCLLYTSPSPRD